MKNDLIETIGEQLNIPKTEADWTNQVIYSAAGQLALASLWDHCEDEDFVSIQHFKNRIAQIFDAYEDIQPQVKYAFPNDKSVLINEMYSIYMRNGFLYHSAYKISPAAPRIAVHGTLCLHRGASPDEKLFMSGLGFYSFQKNKPNSEVADAFGLQKQSFESYLDELLRDSEWETIEWPENTEFLKLDPPFKKGYWQQSPNRDERISLARYGEPNKIFVFYRYHDGEYHQKQIPEWRIRDYFTNETNCYDEYRRIATALLKKYDTLPPIEVRDLGGMVEIHMGYRLPPSEEDFFKLYSWPTSFDFLESAPQVFIRKMAKQVYPMFKAQLQSLGYCFVEE